MQSNFDVLIRVISSQDDANAAVWDNDDISSLFTNEEREAIMQVIHEDVEIQQELRKTHTREELTILQNNSALRRLVEPKKWDVLIRVLNEPRFRREDTESIQSATTAEYRTFG